MSIRSRSRVEQGMKAGKGPRAALAIFLWLLIAASSAYSQDQPATPAGAATAAAPDQAPVPSPANVTPAPQAEAQGSAPLRVMVGKSLLINTTGERLKRVSVTDPHCSRRCVVAAHADPGAWPVRG